MDTYKTEEEQVEALKKWWEDNGMAIIAGVVIGLSAIFGWRGWNEHLIAEAEAASDLYEQMLVSSRQNEFEITNQIADQIISNHESTTYAVFAGLMLAKIAAESNELDKAEEQLRWVLKKNDQNEIEHIARLRLTRVLIANNKLDEALSTLDAVDPEKFNSRYEELRGDIFLKQGDKDKAKSAYQNALLKSVASDESQPLLEMKLDDLGGA